MADVNVVYLEDATVLPSYFQALFDYGYIPSLAKSLRRPKGDIEHKVRHSYHRGQNLTDCADISLLLDMARDNPGMGIGVMLPYTTIPDIHLHCFDVDFKFEDLDKEFTLAKCIASVVQKPTPTRVGGKGFGMFFTMRHDWDREPLERYRKAKRINHKVMLSHDAYVVEDHGMTAGHHMVIPPSAYPTGDGSDAPGGMQYRWVPFPSTNPNKRRVLNMLEDDDAALENLPCLNAQRLMEVVLHATRMLHPSQSVRHVNLWDNPDEEPPHADNKVRDYILSEPYAPNSGYRARTMEAVHSYIGEGFPPEYTRIRMIEILQDHKAHPEWDHASWGDDDNEYLDELDELIKGSVSKIEEKGGPKPSKRRAEAKIPDERVVQDWMEQRFPLSQCCLFNGEVQFWNLMAWAPVRLRDPDLLGEVLSEHPMAARTSIDRGMQTWMDRVKPPPEDHKITCATFTNGAYDFLTNEFRPPTMTDYNPYVMRSAYDPDAECPLWDAQMQRMFQLPAEVAEGMAPERIIAEQSAAMRTFEEYMGGCMTTDTSFQKVLFVIGATGTGKSTLWKMTELLFPKNVVGGVAYEDLGNATSRSGLVGKMLNIGREVGRRAHASDQALLAITSGDPVEVHTMFVSRVQIHLHVHMIFDGNNMPSSSDTAGAFQRRAIFLRTTDAKLEDENQDPLFHDKLAQELPGIVARWTRAYVAMLERGYYKPPSYSRDAGEAIRQGGNSSTLFIHDTIEAGDDVHTIGTLYRSYREWCEENGHRFINSQIFGQDLTREGYPSVLKWNPVFKKPVRVRLLKFNDPLSPTLRLVKDSY